MARPPHQPSGKTPEPSGTTPESFWSKAAKVVLSTLLIVAGIGLIAASAYLWLPVDARHPPSKVTVRSVTATAKHPATKKSKPATTRVVVTKTTTRTPAAQSTRSRRSQTLTGTLLVLGVLLLLVGAFYSRISEITLPGGGALKLFQVTPPPATQAKIAQVLGASPDLTSHPEKAEIAYLAALGHVQSEMAVNAQAAAAEGRSLDLKELTPSDDSVTKWTQEAIQKVL